MNLSLLADNPQLLEEVKQIVLKHFSVDKIIYDSGTSNEQLGAVARTILNGRDLVEDAFKEIETHRTIKSEENEAHPAR